MQHKQRSRAGIFIVILIGIVAGTAIMLMTKDIKPTQQAVEKQLDASAFLGNK